MHLRHIDPRSADWMDAMTDGDSEREGRQGRTRGASSTELSGERAGPSERMVAAPAANVRGGEPPDKR